MSAQQTRRLVAAGWSWSAFNGESGGWSLDLGDGKTRVVCRDADSRKWQAFIVRNDDGETLHHSEHGTRDEATRRLSLRVA